MRWWILGHSRFIWDRSGCARKRRAWPPLPNLVGRLNSAFDASLPLKGCASPVFQCHGRVDLVCRDGKLGFHGACCARPRALGVLDMDVLVPPGGVLSNGAPANLPVAPGDLLLSPVQSPTSMFHVLVDDEANMTWAEQTLFAGFS